MKTTKQQQIRGKDEELSWSFCAWGKVVHYGRNMWQRRPIHLIIAEKCREREREIDPHPSISYAGTPQMA
jgi:hypothetical protein